MKITCDNEDSSIIAKKKKANLQFDSMTKWALMCCCLHTQREMHTHKIAFGSSFCQEQHFLSNCSLGGKKREKKVPILALGTTVPRISPDIKIDLCVYMVEAFMREND